LLTQLRDQGALEKVGLLDLRFSLLEVQGFLQTRQIRSPSAADSRRLHELPGGGAANMSLAAMNLSLAARAVYWLRRTLGTCTAFSNAALGRNWRLA